MPEKKKNFFNCKNCSVCSLWAISALLFIAIGGGFYYLIDTYFFDESEEETEEAEDSEVDEYENWQTFTHDDYSLTIRYPEGWEVDDKLSCEEYPLECGELRLSHEGYIWQLAVDPITTGGGFGYMFDGILEERRSLWSTVSPAGYESIVKSVFVDPLLSEGVDFEPFQNINYGSWGGSVLFQRGKVGEMIGFGPGQMYDEIEGNYFGVSYFFESTMDDFSDLPVKDDEGFTEKLSILNRITNSIDLGDGNFDKVWKTVEFPNMRYKLTIPTRWDYEEISSESGYYARFDDMDVGNVFYLGAEEHYSDETSVCEYESAKETLQYFKVLTQDVEMLLYECYVGEEEVEYGVLIVRIDSITNGMYENLVFSHSFNKTDLSLEGIRGEYGYIPIILESLEVID